MLAIQVGPGAASRPVHGGFPGVCADASAHTLADCERKLRARADFNPFRGRPAVHFCTCGRVFDFTEDEAEGASWVLRS